MDQTIDSQTTRKLSKTQLMIKEALKNAPPLIVSQKPANEFIVLVDKRFDDNSVFGRFLKHKTVIEHKNEDNNNGYKWWQLKDKLTLEMENKRIQNEKYKEINDKLENEETEEMDEDIEEDNEEDDDGQSENEQSKQNKLEQSNDLSDKEDSQDDEEVEELDNASEQDEEEEEEDDCDEEEIDESDREANPFLNDEAEEDEADDENEEEYREGISIYESQSKIRQRDTDIPNAQTIVNEVNDNSNSSHSFNDSFERNDDSIIKTVCATQKFAVSPFITQKPKSVFNQNPGISDLIPPLIIDNEEFNSQSLVDLCSGNFIESISDKAKELANEDNDSDEEDLNEPKKTKKVFNVESDDESESDDQKLDTQSIVSSLRRFNESDGEDLLVTDGEQSEEEGADEDDEKEVNINSFFDAEAELSGSDASSDEEEENEDEQQEEEGEQEDLPSDSELKDQIGRFHQ